MEIKLIEITNIFMATIALADPREGFPCWYVDEKTEESSYRYVHIVSTMFVISEKAYSFQIVLGPFLVSFHFAKRMFHFAKRMFHFAKRMFHFAKRMFERVNHAEKIS